MSKELRELRDQRLADGVRAGSATSPDADTNRSRDTSVSATQSSIGVLLDDFEFLGLDSFELSSLIVSKQVVIEAFNLWLLRVEAMRAPMPLSKIQALLMLCVWPLPVANQREDPSWLYCGIAVNAALYMSLHRSGLGAGTTPSFHSVGVPSGTAHERTKTWLGCFYVSTSLSMHLGLPPMINTASDLSNMRTILSEHTLPREFSLHIRVLLIMASFTNVLAYNSNDGVVDSSVTQLLEGELDTLKTTFSDGWTSMVDYSIMVVKMHVYTLIITRSRSGTGSREILLKLGLATALRIIHLANLRFHDSQENAHNLTTTQREKTLSKDYYRGLAFATIFLIRYFSLNKSANAEEQQLAANHVIMAHTIFKALATYPGDEYTRAATLFETLCKQAPIPTDTGKPSLIDRMGVSIVLDAINTARELRGCPIVMSEPEFPSTTEALTAQNNHNNNNNIAHQDVYNATPHLVEPWPSDLAFANEFWGDPTWDVFNISIGTPQQFHPAQGL
ncbi:hypothetical protein AAE478_009031 [Parahypoxylon ruwenzoriense]